jgi:RNA polymerase sigma-70 factor (ECF subfamily)
MPLTSVVPAAVLSPELAEARAELIELVVRAQRGDLDAQSELVRKYMRRIGSYLRPLVGQPSAVEDVVQVVFIKMVRQLHLLREPGFFETWLYTLSRNTAFDAVRHRHRRIATVYAEEELLRLPESTNEFAMNEMLDTVDSALTLLRPTDRRLLDHILQGDSYDAAGAKEGLTRAAVKARISRVRARLRKKVKTSTLTLHARKPGGPSKMRLAA